MYSFQIIYILSKYDEKTRKIVNRTSLLDKDKLYIFYELQI